MKTKKLNVLLLCMNTYSIVISFLLSLFIHNNKVLRVYYLQLIANIILIYETYALSRLLFLSAVNFYLMRKIFHFI